MTPPPGSGDGASDALRSAIERTFEATTGSAAETRARAGQLLDEVVRRAREAGEASASKVGDAIGELRERDEVQRIERELGSLSDRLAGLESAIRAEADKRRKS